MCSDHVPLVVNFLTCFQVTVIQLQHLPFCPKTPIVDSTQCCSHDAQLQIPIYVLKVVSKIAPSDIFHILELLKDISSLREKNPADYFCGGSCKLLRPALVHAGTAPMSGQMEVREGG